MDHIHHPAAANELRTGRCAATGCYCAAASSFRDDHLALAESAKELRRQFEAHRAETDTLAIQEMLRGVQANEMLLYHIAQGRRNEEGNYEVKITPEQGGKMETETEIAHIDSDNIPPKPKPP